MSGSLGTATEANYCSANAFLDEFACYRRSTGRPGTAIGLGIISEVGYLHDHPEIEKLLLRKGIQPINEQELLQICDIALSNQGKSLAPPSCQPFAEGHLLTGLESRGMVNLRRQGFEALSHVLEDPRAELLANSLFEEYEKEAKIDFLVKDAPGTQLSTVLAVLRPNGVRCASPTDIALLDAIQSVVGSKICDLLLLTAEQLTPHTPLGTFGMDSMLAADSRHFIFHTFHVDVPFLVLLAPHTAVASLAGLIGFQLWSNAEHI